MNRSFSVSVGALATPLLAAGQAPSLLRLPSIFTPHMVLQRNAADPVWGWAKPGDRVTVQFGTKSITSSPANGKGEWKVKLAPMAANSTPQTLSIVDGNQKIVLPDVLVGEVWLCSGQSNMQYPMSGWFNRTNLQPELAKADHPTIRFYHVPMIPSMFAGRPHETAPTAWQVCTPSTAAGTSAVGYMFANDLRKQLHVPIGILEADWGGTSIEAWIPAQGYLDQTPQLPEVAWLKPAMLNEQLLKGGPAPANASGLVNSPHGFAFPYGSGWLADPRQNPTTLFNGMINPLIPYRIRGAVWYQGETNVMSHDHVYFDHLHALIGGWRSLWHQGNFPFTIIQIAPFDYSPSWCGANQSSVPYEPLIWQAEEKAAAKLKNVGLVSTMDIGDVHDIHPADKADLADRLAAFALKRTYHVPGFHAFGPTLEKAKVNGSEVTLHFAHTDGGLASKDGLPISWFAVAGANGVYVSAQASIRGNDVIVQVPGDILPRSVRFAWNCMAQPNLINHAGLTAMPFEVSLSSN